MHSPFVPRGGGIVLRLGASALLIKLVTSLSLWQMFSAIATCDAPMFITSLRSVAISVVSAACVMRSASVVAGRRSAASPAKEAVASRDVGPSASLKSVS